MSTPEEIDDPGERALPAEIADAGWLNPWAVTMRYGETVAGLDRESAVRVAESCLNWAGERVEAARPASD